MWSFAYPNMSTSRRVASDWVAYARSGMKGSVSGCWYLLCICLKTKNSFRGSPLLYHSTSNADQTCVAAGNDNCAVAPHWGVCPSSFQRNCCAHVDLILLQHSHAFLFRFNAFRKVINIKLGSHNPPLHGRAIQVGIQNLV